MQFEEENFEQLMDEASQRRSKAKMTSKDVVPMTARATKAFEAICICCIPGERPSSADADILVTILTNVFPTASKDDIVEFATAAHLANNKQDDKPQDLVNQDSHFVAEA
eukprot:SM003345S12868  [mRNA]  locus=s3345:658:1136:+ [translate_table: standard]